MFDGSDVILYAATRTVIVRTCATASGLSDEEPVVGYHIGATILAAYLAPPRWHRRTAHREGPLVTISPFVDWSRAVDRPLATRA
jgi:hypothetical protein